ncbi:uncharacterized protein LOC143038468 isoform X2 [Oratosquilla oratoria]|uniref:uncharacterized protein LOC143038468 isoform X2 n=1 Tax=Oratosquilla oratoria TaxID=337810 RepID=UPI003F75DA53
MSHTNTALKHSQSFFPERRSMPAKVTTVTDKMSQKVDHSLLHCETEEEFIAAVNNTLDSYKLPPPNEDVFKAIGHWKGMVVEKRSLSGCTALCRLLVEYLSPNYSYAHSLNKWLLIDGFLGLLDISLEPGICHEHQQYERLAFWEIHNDLLQTLIRDFPLDTVEHFSILSSSLLKNITNTSKDKFSRQLHLKSLNLLLEQAPGELRHKLKRNHDSNINALPDLLFEVGDYDFQASIVEALFRTSVRSERAVLVSQWFSQQDCTIQSLFVRIVDFDPDCRRFLNALNQSQGESRKVHSFVCLAAAFGSVILEKPKDPNYEHFWVDFNEGSCTVLLMCAKLGETSSQQKREWESLLVYKHEVIKACLHQTLHTQALILTLNRPPRDFFSSPVPESYEARLSDHMTLEFSPKLNLVNVCQKIYGDKFEVYIYRPQQNVTGLHSKAPKVEHRVGSCNSSNQKKCSIGKGKIKMSNKLIPSEVSKGCTSTNDTPRHHPAESKCSYGNSSSAFSALSSRTIIAKESDCVIEESSQECIPPSQPKASLGSRAVDNTNENQERMTGINGEEVRRTLESEGTPGAATLIPWTQGTESGSSIEMPKLQRNKRFKLGSPIDNDSKGSRKLSKPMPKISAPSSGGIETVQGKVNPIVVEKTKEEATLTICDEDVVPSSLGEKERNEITPLLKKGLPSINDAMVIKENQLSKSSETCNENTSLQSCSAVGTKMGEKSCVTTKQDEIGALNSSSCELLIKGKDQETNTTDKSATGDVLPEIPPDNSKNLEFASTQGFTPAISKAVHKQVEYDSPSVTLPASENMTTVEMSEEQSSPHKETGNVEKQRISKSSLELESDVSDILHSKNSIDVKCVQEGDCKMTFVEKTENMNHLVGKIKGKLQENVLDTTNKCDERNEPVAGKDSKDINGDHKNCQCKNRETEHEGKIYVACNECKIDKLGAKENIVEVKSCTSERMNDSNSTYVKEVCVTSDNSEIKSKKNQISEKEGCKVNKELPDCEQSENEIDGVSISNHESIKKTVPYNEPSKDSKNYKTNKDGNESDRTTADGRESKRTNDLTVIDENRDRIGEHDREIKTSVDSRENATFYDVRKSGNTSDGKEYKSDAESREDDIKSSGRKRTISVDDGKSGEMNIDESDRDITKVCKKSQRTGDFEKKKKDSIKKGEFVDEMDSKHGRVACSSKGTRMCATYKESNAMSRNETCERDEENITNLENELGGRITPETFVEGPGLSKCTTVQSAAGKNQESISEKNKTRTSRSRSRSGGKKSKSSDEHNHPSMASNEQDSHGSVSPVRDKETRGRKRKLFNNSSADILQETPPEISRITNFSKTDEDALGRDTVAHDKKSNLESCLNDSSRKKQKKQVSSSDLDEADSNQHREGENYKRLSGKLGKQKEKRITARKQRKRNKWKKQWECKRKSFSREDQFLESPHADSDLLGAQSHTIYSDFDSSDGYSWINGKMREKEKVPIYHTYEKTQNKKGVKRRKPRKKHHHTIEENVQSDSDKIFVNSHKKSKNENCNLSKCHTMRSTRKEINYHETSELSSSSLTETSCSKVHAGQEKRDKKDQALMENEISNETERENEAILRGKQQWSNRIKVVGESPEVLRNTSHGTLSADASTTHDLSHGTSLNSVGADKNQKNVSSYTEYLSPEIFDAAYFDMAEQVAHRSSSVDRSILLESLLREKRTEFNVNSSDPYPPLKVPHNTPDSGAMSPIPAVPQNLTAQIFSRLHSESSEKNSYNNPLQSTLINEGEGRDNHARFTYVSEAEVSYNDKLQPIKETLSHSNTHSSNNMNYSAKLNDGLPSWLPLEDTSDQNRYETSNLMPTQPWSPFGRDSSESGSPQVTDELQNPKASLNDNALNKNQEMDVIDSVSKEDRNELESTEDQGSSMNKDDSQPDCNQESEKPKNIQGSRIPTQVALTLSQLVDSFPQTSKSPTLDKGTPQPPNPRVLFLPRKEPSQDGETEKDGEKKIQYLKEQVLAMHNFLREAYFRSLSVLDVVKDLT